ncbi:MAG: type II secretion system F family protein [Bdellovibrionaceae bacterium]|nr:type II secretion system F family protein [Pseudobdellovibrionaceae bacterium]MBX3034147.1 type II secretion system F family protein [Pseudobdellovibrionaceae bacterium]
MRFLANEWILIPLIAVCAFIIVYNVADRALDFLRDKSLGTRSEVIRHMRLMSVPVDEKRLTLLMLFLSFGLGSLFFILFWPKVLVGLLFGVTVTIVGWSLPLIFIRIIYERRCTRFTDQMVDGLTIMANGVKSGSNAPQAMLRVVEIMGNPISQEFKIVLNQTQFGQSFEEALNDLGERIPRPDVQMFVTSVNILKETGGNLAETFQTIVMVIRERQKVEKKIQAMTAQGIMQGLVVTMIPFVLAGVFFLIDPNFIRPMFSTTLGLFLCFAILTLQIIGGIMIKKIVTIKV